MGTIKGFEYSNKRENKDGDIEYYIISSEEWMTIDDIEEQIAESEYWDEWAEDIVNQDENPNY